MSLQQTSNRELTKVTGKGNVVRIIREHYLREDITCKSKQCKSCKHEQEPILDKLPKKSEVNNSESNKQGKAPPVFYIIPTYEVVAKYFDLFELQDSPFKNVIFCETITNELQQQNMKRTYNKIRYVPAER